MEQNNFLAIYEKLVKSAAVNDVDITLPNFDNTHSKIMYKYMLLKARKYIYLYVEDFENSFFKGLIKEFNQVKDDVEIIIISNKKISLQFKNKFKNIKFIIKKTSFPKYFTVIDDIIYNYESFNSWDVKEAFTNFNDKKVSKILKKVFERMKRGE